MPTAGSVDITISLSAPLAEAAASAGLLTTTALEPLLRAELERRNKIERLFQAAGRLSGVEGPAPSLAEIENEIAATRAERNARAGRP